MSIESAMLFMEKLKTDEDFLKKVTECEDKEARMELARVEGFDFTVADLKDWRA